MIISTTAPSAPAPKGSSTTYTCSTSVTVTDRAAKPSAISGVSVTVQWAAVNNPTSRFPVLATLTTLKQGTAVFKLPAYPKSAGGCIVQVTGAAKSGYWVNGLPPAVSATWQP
jgi:hypothetical protein